MSSFNGYQNIKVDLLDAGPENPFQIFYTWYRETWYSLRNEQYDYINPEHWKACVDVLEGRALPIPQEALNFQIRIEGLSRVALAQITRARVGFGACVTSQMPEPIEHAVTIPMNIFENSQFGERARQLTDQSQSLYDDMIAAGIPPQDCRYLTLHGQQTNMVCYMNFSTLRSYFSRRCENGLTDELNLVGRMIRRELISRHLNVDGADRIEGSGWSFLLGKLEAMGADQKCLNGDEVFGNTGRAPSAGSWVPSWTNDKKKSDYDFSKSAWYYELLHLPDELLFKGEREMVEDFKTIGFEGRLRKLGS